MEIPAEDLASLSGIERRALLVARWLNASRLQRLSHWLNTRIHRRWVQLFTGRRVHLVGIDRMSAMRPDRGVLLASNHRSFFDQIVITTYLYKHVDTWPRFYFPVRSEFFYDSLFGIALNIALTSCTMFPPIFRPRLKRGVTRAGLNFLAQQLQSPSTLCGIHPEGTRGKGPDPYELLPAEPGFGRVVLQARPIVVPVFIGGLSNDIVTEVKRNFSGGDPVIILFGDPVDLSDFDDENPRLLRNQVKVGRRVLQDVAALAQQEKQVRAQLQSDAAGVS
ncbi:MAG TPA: hypothetical protein DIC52_20120 [Candidatus Latescibacteria bacterium]|nr:hypothetical protein [Candidatus Latescibacterota bacterium]|tara:strand:- start:1956 stop:2789 length:834 start_codon:yes stop_codon:yes gene_type:complete